MRVSYYPLIPTWKCSSSFACSQYFLGRELLKFANDDISFREVYSKCHIKPFSTRPCVIRFPCCVLLALSWNTTNENPSTYKLSRAINKCVITWEARKSGHFSWILPLGVGTHVWPPPSPPMLKMQYWSRRASLRQIQIYFTSREMSKQKDNQGFWAVHCRAYLERKIIFLYWSPFS